jgi:hypothetical protein
MVVAPALALSRALTLGLSFTALIQLPRLQVALRCAQPLD